MKEKDLNLCTARILKVNGSTAGSAFLFSEKYLLTCSHVVLLALGLDVETQVKPEGIMQLEFPCLDDGSQGNEEIRKYEVKVIQWYPTVSQGKVIKDIAVLELIKDYPQLINPVGKFVKFKALDTDKLVGRSVAAFGFPEGNAGGELAKGEIQCAAGYGLVQIDGTKVTGSRIQPGFSGTAIFDEQNKVILGIAKRENSSNPDSKIALMIPTTLLLGAWKPLGEYCEDDRLDDLLEILRAEQCEPSIIDRLYNSILGEKINLDQLSNEANLQQKLINLSQYSGDEYSELERFAVDLHNIEAKLSPQSRLAQRLNTWLKKYVDKKSALFETRGQISEKKPVEPTLLIRFEQRTPSLNNPQINGVAKAWFIENFESYQNDHCGDDAQRIELLDEREFSIQQQVSIESVVNDFLNQCHRQILDVGGNSTCVKRIYFSLESINMLKRKSRIFEIDFWLEEEEGAIGELYQVMFSLMEYRNLLCQESELPKSLLKAQSKAVTFKEKLNSAAGDILKVVSSNPERPFKKAIRQDDCVALGLNTCLESEDYEDILTRCLKAGIPLMVWNIKDCEQSIEDLVRDGLIRNIGESVRKYREEGYDDDEHIGRNLLVFWDLPEPKNQLQWVRSA